MPKAKKKKNSKPVKPVFHIYCEGEKTEPYYIKGFIENFYSIYRNILIIENTNKNTPVQLVEEAIYAKQAGAPNDIYWVVFDRESISKYSIKYHNDACQKAKSNNIEIALSNVCFELWLLSHFTSSSACYTSYDNLISESDLKNKLASIGIEKYKKAHTNLFRLIKEHLPCAISNCEIINSTSKYCSSDQKPYNLNPYTDFHELLIDIKNFVDGRESIRLCGNELNRNSLLKSCIDFFTEE